MNEIGRVTSYQFCFNFKESTQILKLDLSGEWHISNFDTFMQELNHFTVLESLTMRNGKMALPKTYSDKVKVDLPRLKFLDLSGSFEDCADAFVSEHLGHYHLPSLTLFKFNDNSLTQLGLTSLLSLQNLKWLKILSVANNKIKKFESPLQNVEIEEIQNARKNFMHL